MTELAQRTQTRTFDLVDSSSNSLTLPSVSCRVPRTRSGRCDTAHVKSCTSDFMMSALCIPTGRCGKQGVARRWQRCGRGQDQSSGIRRSPKTSSRSAVLGRTRLRRGLLDRVFRTAVHAIARPSDGHRSANAFAAGLAFTHFLGRVKGASYSRPAEWEYVNHWNARRHDDGCRIWAGRSLRCRRVQQRSASGCGRRCLLRCERRGPVDMVPFLRLPVP